MLLRQEKSVKTKVAAIFALPDLFYVKVEYDTRFLRQDHESGAASTIILQLFCRGVTTGTSYSTFQPVRQRQTTEKRRREPIRPARRAEIMAEAAQSLQNNPRQSMRAMVKDVDVSDGTVCTIVKEDLGCKLYTRPKRHLISSGAKSRCHKSYRSLFSKDAGGGRVVILEERGLPTF